MARPDANRPAPGRSAEWWTGQSLRIGVILSAVLVAAGFLLFLFRPAATAGAGANVAAVAAGVLRLDPGAIINLGLLVLIGTSVFRVAAAALAFGVEGDYAYAVICTLVLLVLLVSFALGKGE